MTFGFVAYSSVATSSWSVRPVPRSMLSASARHLRLTWLMTFLLAPAFRLFPFPQTSYISSPTYTSPSIASIRPRPPHRALSILWSHLFFPLSLGTRGRYYRLPVSLIPAPYHNSYSVLSFLFFRSVSLLRRSRRCPAS